MVGSREKWNWTGAWPPKSGDGGKPSTWFPPGDSYSLSINDWQPGCRQCNSHTTQILKKRTRRNKHRFLVLFVVLSWQWLWQVEMLTKISLSFWAHRKRQELSFTECQGNTQMTMPKILRAQTNGWIERNMRLSRCLAIKTCRPIGNQSHPAAAWL